jgi:ABC-2 type transport system permease protein
MNLAAQIYLRTWKKILRRPVTLSFSLVQPMLWLLLFGFLMQRYPIAELPEGIDYKTFIVPGICAMTVLFGASQAGIQIIRDIQTGFFQRMALSPASHAIMHGAKIAADGSRLVLQAMVVLFLSALLGASLQIHVFDFVIGLLALFFFAVAFGSLSCFVALRAKKQETLATFVHLVNFPLFFTSTALVPHKQMPEWLARIAAWNPLTLTVDLLRQALLPGTQFVGGSLLPLVILSVVFSALAVTGMKKSVSISAWEVR